MNDMKATEERLARALNEIHLWQERYRTVSENIPFGIWICDNSGKLTYCSEAILELLGMTFKQVAGAGWYVTLHPDDVEETARAWDHCVQTGQNWVRLLRYKGKDGKYHPVLARGRPLRDGSGNIREWIGVNFDVADLIGIYEELKAKGSW